MQNCQKCYFKRWYKSDRTKNGLRYWKCGRCGREQLEEEPFIRQKPRVLYLDIESSLSKSYTWGLRVRGEFISPELLINEYYIICWSASWVGEKQVYSGCVSPSAAKQWSDKSILKPLWKLMNSADIVAGHNVDKFDIKKINTRFKVNGLAPPFNYRTLDTLKIARSKFGFESNKLDYIAQRLGFRPKDAMSLQDWIKIAETGDEKTLVKMVKYNKGDVAEGKKVLAALQDWAEKPTSYGSRTIPSDPQSDIEILLEDLQGLR